MLKHILFIFLFSISSMTAQSQTKPEINDSITNEISKLQWLSGSWFLKEPDFEVEELWMAPKGNLILGLSRTLNKKGKSSFEFMRIAQSDSGIYFYGSPQGSPATPFKLIKAAENYIEFENKHHDFPQKIIYQLIKPGQLFAKIEGLVNDELKHIEWNYHKVD